MGRLLRLLAVLFLHLLANLAQADRFLYPLPLDDPYYFSVGDMVNVSWSSSSQPSYLLLWCKAPAGQRQSMIENPQQFLNWLITNVGETSSI